MNIYEKMLHATDKIGTVQKKLKIQLPSGSYKAVAEADILDAVKPIELELGIFSYPSARKVISSEVLTEAGKTNKNLLRIEVTYRFVNIEKPEEYIETVSYGDGIDTGDKAPGKAMTYADKYALMKSYKIDTGDDPDQKASPAPEKKAEPRKEAPPIFPDTLYVTELQMKDLLLLEDTKRLQDGYNSLKEFGATFMKEQNARIKARKEQLIKEGK
jgi:hypothetical protein